MSNNHATPRLDILAVSLTMHLLALALPLALLQIYDRILPSQAYGTAIFLIIGTGVAIILEALLRYGRMALFANLGSRYEAKTTMRALDRLLYVDIAEIEHRGSAVISDALRSISQVRDFWSGQAGAALYEAPFVLIYLAVIAYIGGWLVLIPLLLFIIAVTSSFVLNPSISRAAKEVESEDRQRHDFIWTTFAAINDIKAMSAEGMIGATYRKLNNRYMEKAAKLENRMSWMRENASLFGQLSTTLIVAFGAVSVVQGTLTTGALAACTILAGRSIGPAMASLGYWSQLARMGEAQARVDRLLNIPDNPAFKSNITEEAKSPHNAIVGEVKIDAPTLLVKPIIIKPGEVVHIDTRDTRLASHLLSRVSGMTHDSSINVSIDGRPQDSYMRDIYRDNVILVSRQSVIVPGSILNNLTLFDQRYNALAYDYSQALGLQPYLDKMRYGILTEIGSGATEYLDEGLCQRIALIRALLRKPKILLLDHAANSLDLDGVKKLAELIKSLQGNTTVLIATYKQPLIEVCTNRLFLESKKA